MKKNEFIIYCLFTLILFSSCASTGFLMAKPKVTLFGKTYPAKDDIATIDVYITNKPTQEYIEFAKIIIADTNEKWNIEQLTKKAREIGADALIIIGKAGTSGVGTPMGTSSYIVSHDYGMSAIAIKYIKK